MATLELDPTFVKALRLLHSRSKDSASQLRAMVDEAIAARKAQKSQDGEGRGSKASSKEEETKKREAEKRGFEKLKQDISDLGTTEAKKPKLDTSSSSQSKEDRKEREKEKEKARKEKERKEHEREKERQEKERQKELEREKERERAKEKAKEATVSDEDTEEEEDGGMAMDAGDFAIGLGISCEVCRLFDVSSGNQLVECQECHALYHQECHKPPVTEQDVNDPRFVWYCNKCSKTVKKSQVSQKPAKSKTSQSSSKESSSSSKSSKSEPAPNPATFAFRRMELKPSTATTKESHSSSASSKPLSGFASLAANLSKPATSKSDSTKPFQTAWKTDIAKPSSKDAAKSSKEGKVEKGGSPSGAGTSGSSSSSKGNSGNGSKQVTALSASAVASANLRLQKMKKNASKQQEKRVHIK